MPESRRRRVFVILLTVVLALGLGGFLVRDVLFFTFVYTGSRADWELMQLRRQVAIGQANESDESVRKRCFEIASENPGSRAELTSYLFVVKQYPESADAHVAYDNLLEAAKHVDIGDWTRSLHDVRPGDGSERWRPLGGLLIERVRQRPDHPKAASLLCEVGNLVALHQVESASEEFVAVADLIRERYAASKGLANFCEQVGGMGDTPAWGRTFEPHVRHILKVNQDRFVRCSAHFALASIVRSGGIERQPEAQQLFKDFLDEFDGETEYDAQGIEQMNRDDARQILERMRLHGLGMPAPETIGVDLDGQPMSLADYREKVVLISFWATWCAPCMKAIPHEKELLEHFGAEQFAIVGVNGDKTSTVALEAVAEHGISWRSFQVNRKDGSSIASDWHIGGWPTFYLLDAEGVIARSWQGLPPQSVLRAAIGELIEKVDTREDTVPQQTDEQSDERER